MYYNAYRRVCTCVQSLLSAVVSAASSLLPPGTSVAVSGSSPMYTCYLVKEIGSIYVGGGHERFYSLDGGIIRWCAVYLHRYVIADDTTLLPAVVSGRQGRRTASLGSDSRYLLVWYRLV